MVGEITNYFGANLAALLAEKISAIAPEFNSKSYIKSIKKGCANLSYTQRIALHADELYKHLPSKYLQALKILTSILGPENPHETGMFKEYYWLMPIGKFIEVYGLQYPKQSIKSIGEVTRRNTGEYAIRPFLRAHTDLTMEQMRRWAASDNFHLRRLASEGLRPKLPWAPKLDLFVDRPKPVFEILELLRDDSVMFVKKSVANHLTDYLKVNPEAVRPLIARWRKSNNADTQWILKRATRKLN